jgi:flagellar FliL protein
MSEAAAAVAADSPPSGNKKKLFLIIVAVLMLLAGVAGATYYFVAGAQANGTDSADEQSAKGKKGKQSKPVAPAIYYKVDPALVVNFQANGVTRFLQVGVDIATRDEAIAEKLKQHDPVIRNDLLLLFGSQNEATVISREGKERLRAEALEVVRNVIENEGGDGEKVENIYFTSFVMQ